LEETSTYAVGHFALGYILAKLTSKATKTRVIVALIFLLSVIPDVDILIPYVVHRGPFHSIIMATIVFIPILALYHKNALPYFIATIQHSLLSDYIAGGKVQLLWPLTQQTFGLELSIQSPTNITIEWLSFLTATFVMIKTKDTHLLLQPKNSNLILTIPTFTVLLPTFLAFPLEVPTALIPPHIIFLILFLVSISIDLKYMINKGFRKDFRLCKSIAK
jgi:membrane-bound metal-dependent hydrolase YbcI (DUF457 family)